MESPSTPQDLCRDWLDSNAAEDAAKTRRIEIENALIAQLGAKSEGSKTHDLGEFKVTITGVVNRTLDKEIWETIKDKLPQEVRPVTYEPKLDITGVKWLQEHQPEDYRILAQAMIVRPGKVGVKVVQINKS
jgi:hypothetical protein